mmetsp:Transcript_16899/g.33010  ORF Transcript_16899/g.33010 Transcript_16899/m.33010 type:complete len:887 (-) Transcript_16899:180-2840(-)
MGRRDEDGMDDEESPFANMDRNLVLREARCFNDKVVNPGKCSIVLTKILYLLNQGEEISQEEALDVFFACTKLFQCKNVHLRRMVYLLIKTLKIDQDNRIIVVSCLNKDMTSTHDLFRANAIRVLAKIMDPSMLSSIERFLKQAVVDKNPFIVSATLCAGQHITARGGLTITKQWVNQLQEALSNSSAMVEYQALALLYRVKQQDQLAVSKVAAALVKNPPKGSMAQCLQIRIIVSLLNQQGSIDQTLLNYIINCLHNKPVLVMYEAARAICKLKALSAVQVTPAVSVLQDYLTSPIPAQRFAAVRTLSQLVVRFPLVVTVCSVDLERLLTDPNRNIATLAITTLLKTGAESNVDRLVGSISGFMSEISDEFRIVMVNAIKTLCLKFPNKFQGLMNFLASSLREEGGFQYKKAIVDSMLEIISAIPEAQESGLEHFCEFIEDCEFPELSVKILSMLGEKGPKTTNPGKYIRFIFNRVILETSVVRAAAVSSLAKFGTAEPSLTESVVVLLKRCLNDNDDEVRDRSVFYLNLLDPQYKNFKSAQALLVHNSIVGANQTIRDLEFSLQVYLENPTAEPFSLQSHMLKCKESEDEKAATAANKASEQTSEADLGGGEEESKAAAGNPYLSLLNSIPEFSDFGDLFKSCKPIEVTEGECEYVVSCVKHIYAQNVIFQFNITNNMEDQFLENVSVEMEPDNASWQEELLVPEATIKYSEQGTVFVAVARPDDAFTSGSIGNTLKFEYKDVDDGEPIGDAQADEYQLEELEVSESDFVIGSHDLGLVEFRKTWEALGTDSEVVKKYSLGLDSLQAAVDAVCDLLGLAPCESSGIVPEDARSHAVNLAGIFLDGTQVLARAGFMLGKTNSVTLKIAVRSTNSDANELLCGAVR